MQVTQPYVEARDFIPVRALVRGERRDGQVIGGRGGHVYLSWRSDVGNHLRCAPAEDVDGRGRRHVMDVATLSFALPTLVLQFASLVRERNDKLPWRVGGEGPR